MGSGREGHQFPGGFGRIIVAAFGRKEPDPVREDLNQQCRVHVGHRAAPDPCMIQPFNGGILVALAFTKQSQCPGTGCFPAGVANLSAERQC